MPHIFISYSRKDAHHWARPLANKLNRLEGISAWMDYSVRYGADWEREIQYQINCCDVMVVLCSADINRHDDVDGSYVLTEIAYAKQIGKRIIPVLLEQINLPISIVRYHRIDFTARDLTLDDLVSALCYEFDIDLADPIIPSPYPRPEAPNDAKLSGDLTLTPPSPTAEAVRKVIGEPFEWCRVPSGEFIYSDNTAYKPVLPTFSMSKYLITYSQFQVFIESADGFGNSRWWQGLACDQSSLPGEQAFKRSNHPRERVSWYDAIAFCRWLSYRLGGGYAIDKVGEWKVRLPTDYEWEKAARGPDGLLFPYGNEFDKTKCNTRESDINHTTAVTKYADGQSPYGVFDLCGNVWEWCLTNWSKPEISPRKEDLKTNSRRVLRGGSWSHNRFSVRTVYRFYAPDDRLSFCGFRICHVF